MTRLYELSADDCIRLLRSHPTQLGRVAFDGDDGLTVLPVNYRMFGDEVVFHTGAGSLLWTAVMRSPVAFQADEVNIAWQEGWSVLVRGQAREIDEPEQVEAMAATLHSWAARDSRTVAITPTRITGRRIV